jgi:hypothetical protein
VPLDPARRLDRLRESRVRPDRAVALGALVREASDEFRRAARRAGGAGAAWAEACPAALAARTAVDGVSRGVLTIHADDAPTRFEVDRWLRAGGEREVVRRCPATVRKIRVVIASAAETRVSRPPPSSRARS